MTGRKLEVLAGKPSALMLQAALDLLGLPAERCLMTGDRLETDIRMGSEAGMKTALVLTGATRRSDLAGARVQPDWVLERVDEILQLDGTFAHQVSEFIEQYRDALETLA
jgi:ribonucleotide monophosphatase NagD (HAD superfamily)